MENLGSLVNSVRWSRQPLIPVPPRQPGIPRMPGQPMPQRPRIGLPVMPRQPMPMPMPGTPEMRNNFEKNLAMQEMMRNREKAMRAQREAAMQNQYYAALNQQIG